MTPPADVSEKSLEELIVAYLVDGKDDPGETTRDDVVSLPDPRYGKIPGYVEGHSKDFDRDHALDTVKLFGFLEDTQPETFKTLGLGKQGTSTLKFLHRLQGEISKRGVIDVLRKGVKHGPCSVDLFYGTPTPGNAAAMRLYVRNVFSITRQLRYSKDETRLALDLCLFINGLPFATFELKNRLTKQTVEDAVNQYKRDRDPKELLFGFGRCAVHFAVDDQRVKMCTALKGKSSWFLPFDRGFDDGAGNPPNPNGLATDYLWKKILVRKSLTDILENYAQIVVEKNERTGKKTKKQIFPRYHQLKAVRKLLSHAQLNGTGQRYLIQHSAGSGKSYSITWLAHQLVELKKNGRPVFDSVVVVTDRNVLDRQIRDNIRKFAQVSAVVGAVTKGSGQLKTFLRQGRKIIISTVHKFSRIVDEIGSDHRGASFAIIIDEAHSSHGGRMTANMNIALSEQGEEEEESFEDKINRIMESRKMLSNASYFAFTATPKPKTLELFGIPEEIDGNTSYGPIDKYTMKQAIQEGFILDVIAHYTPVKSWYRLVKSVEGDPEFDTRKANKKLRRYVESNEYAIRRKAEIMVDHFHDHVVARRKIDGKARAMVVTSGIQRAIQYYHAFNEYLKERKSPYKSLVAFSGEPEFHGVKVTESSLNGFPAMLIPERFREEPYRFLIVAEKFQTGFDEPLLHTMYVDKTLSGVKAVQTLSRLNRARPQKHDVFVLDFVNDADTIQRAFEPYYRTTILGESTDPNKLHDLKADLDGFQVYSPNEVERFAKLYLEGADREMLDPILDKCAAVYVKELDEDGQVSFKSKGKAFVRTYNFLAAVLPYANAEWEKLSIFMNFLTPKLPAPREEDLSKGILETIDMDSYRAEVKANLQIILADEDGEIGPVPVEYGAQKIEPELELLSRIVQSFNENFGGIEWKDADKIRKVITEEIPEKVDADEAYRNARENADKATARIEHDEALRRIMIDLLADHTELFKQYSDNPDFNKWLSDAVFRLTYETPTKAFAYRGEFPVEDSEVFVCKHLGIEEKWKNINSAIWDFFAKHPGQKLGLSQIKRIAETLHCEINDVLAVLSIMGDRKRSYVRFAYYRRLGDGMEKEIPYAEVQDQTHRFAFEKSIEEIQWNDWADEISVGWIPEASDGKTIKLD